MAHEVRPVTLAWALGFGCFIAFAGAGVAAPPDPVTQLLVASLLFSVVAPVVYLVFDAGDVGAFEDRSVRPFRYLVVVTLGSVAGASLAAFVLGDGRLAVFARALVFLGVFGALSWVTAARARGDWSRP